MNKKSTSSLLAGGGKKCTKNNKLLTCVIKYIVKKFSFKNKQKIRHYDFIFSLGAACTCTDMLRNCHLQNFSYPFDWLWGADFKTRCEILSSGFKYWFNKEDFELEHLTSNTNHAVWKNKKTGLVYNHDFKENTSNIDDSFQEVNEKYQRRTKRLLNFIKQHKKVAIVYLERPNKQDHSCTKQEIIKSWKMLNKKFGKILDVYYIHQVDGLDFPEYHELNKHVFYYEFDYSYPQGEFDWMVDFGKLWNIFKYIQKNETRTNL